MDLQSDHTSNSTAIIRLAGIAKRFGATWANRDVNLAVHEAEIHALVGENGAGKSTLLKLLFGHLQPDRGRIYLRGRPVVFRHPREALRSGVGMVHQQPLIFPRLTTLENIIAGAEPERWGRLDTTRARSRVSALCRTFGFDLPLDLPALELSHAHHQQVEIVRMLYRDAKILLLDEPTSFLAPPEVTHLLELLRSLRVQGHTIVFVSHRLEEVFTVADRISVLVGGQLRGTYLAGATSIDQIARHILTGKAGTAPPQHLDKQSTEILPHRESLPIAAFDTSATQFLVLHQLSTVPAGHDAPLTDVTLPAIGHGEILGIGGMVGNGLRTLARVLAGFTPLSQGRIEFLGRDLTQLSPNQRAQLGFRWLPANPLEEALLPARPLWENVLLGRQRHPEFHSAGFLRKSTVMRRGMELLDFHAVRYENMAQPLDTLSGGNQQKVALAGVLANRPRLVILEQPTRGLDIRAQERLYQVVRSMNAEGVTFLVLSHELDELLALCHRIAILYRGRLMGVAPGALVRRDQLGRWLLGLE